VQPVEAAAPKKKKTKVKKKDFKDVDKIGKSTKQRKQTMHPFKAIGKERFKGKRQKSKGIKKKNRRAKRGR
jgi:hypothetical protein